MLQSGFGHVILNGRNAGNLALHTKVSFTFGCFYLCHYEPFASCHSEHIRYAQCKLSEESYSAQDRLREAMTESNDVGKQSSLRI